MEIEKLGNYKSEGKSKSKNQIILSHTSRNLGDYLSSLSFRFNGKYNKIPHYIIDINGKIYKLFDDLEYSKIFTNNFVNKNSIVICLENLGWLNKEPLKDYYVNWNGDIYNGIVFEKKWRDYFFWHPYTTSQLELTAKLCNKLFKEMSINNKVIGHNTRINGIDKFEGVVTRSNFDVNYTDVSPSFNFEEFLKYIEYE